MQLSPFETLRDAESYYATLAYDGIRLTKHKKRLDMILAASAGATKAMRRKSRWSSLARPSFAPVTPEVREDHAAYIGNWLTVLKGDKRAIFSAAAHVQRAVDFLRHVGGDVERSEA
ncbi:zincin-like metallopeptidase domain-containing protein [Rhizobium leguminosarum]|uniref:zincin-like metallopeptidase domain-containing protein n=1 Tax=Rhizobium leguminosarum TaxID=384 RepID=UPI0013AFDE80|nr:zincin-like metallopeptidase domain-containing protein [Rhizobium leguminosarum]